MEKKLLNWPETGLCLGDDAFPLRRNLLKPFSHRKLSLEKIFNYRLSRARRVVENAFGILASRFRIFYKPIDLKVETIEVLVKAACALHNWLRLTSPRQYFRAGCVDAEDVDSGVINPGTWRQEGGSLRSVDRLSVGYLSNRYGNEAERFDRRTQMLLLQLWQSRGNCNNYIFNITNCRPTIFLQWTISYVFLNHR